MAPTGLTKNTGWQIGARRTFSLPLPDAWAWVISPAAVALWLGETGDLHFVEGARYRTAAGAAGEVRVFKPESHLRLTWQPPGWPRPSTIQVRVLPAAHGRTTLAFHQEHLPDQAAREQRRTVFQRALDRLERDM